jgi:hypothetical protein
MLGAVATIVQPRMIATMPLLPPSVIVVIIVFVLALAGGIVVSGGTRGGRGAVSLGLGKAPLKKCKGRGEAKWGGGRLLAFISYVP